MKQSFKQNIDRILRNPSEIQRQTLSYLRRIHNEKIDFVDPSNPFMELLESAAHCTSAAISRFEVGERKLHAIQAVDPEDIYPHMTELDYVDRFAQPNDVPFIFVFDYDELERSMVDDPINGYKKITIPRDTRVKIGDLDFTLIYSVEIRLMRYGGINVVYLVDEMDPIQVLDSNQITPTYTNDKTNRYLTIKLRLMQVKIERLIKTVTPSTTPILEKTINDQYFFAKVFLEDNNKTWKELRTTHSEQYFDPRVPTAVLKVVDKKVSVTIPQIYIYDETIVGKLRVDIYTTKGPLNIDLGNFSMDDFEVSFNQVIETERNVYNQAINKLNVLKVFSDNFVVGGRDALSMSELRDRVIRHVTGPKNKPITPDEINVALVDNGYDIVKNIENVTNRTFLASRLLPEPTHEQLITAASLSVQTVSFTLREALATGYAIDNGEGRKGTEDSIATSITITPEMYFRNKAGITTFVTRDEINNIMDLPNDQLAIRVNSEEFYKTPFHYVLEYTATNEFDVRAYYLDRPTITSKLFIADNSTTHLSVNTASYDIQRSGVGYHLTIVTNSDEAFKALQDDDVFVQLAYTAPGNQQRVYLNGQRVGKTDEGERVFRFDIETNFFIDSDNELEIFSFFIDSEDPRKTTTGIEQTFDVLYSVGGFMHPEWVRNELDDRIGHFLLPTRIAGVNQEQLVVKFGDSLEYLWKRARNVATENQYKVYEHNVLDTYPEDVYEINPNTGTPAFTIEDGEVKFNLLHRKDDVRLDVDGEPLIRHFSGEVVRDANGNPILASPRDIGNHVDFLLVDGAYWFSNDLVAIDYQTELTDILVDWITNDLDAISPSLLEETNIYFYPKSTTGEVEVMFGSGHLTSISASQSLRVTLHVAKVVYEDMSLREQLKTRTIREINDYFSRDTISISELTDRLRSVYSGDVIDVRVTGLGGAANNFPVVTITNEMDRLSIAKQLVSRPDGVLVVEEDISVDFVRHGKDAYADSF